MDRAKQAAWGRVGGLETYARLGGRGMTAAAQRGFQERFEREVDPGRDLDARDRASRAAAARRAHMLRLAARSAAVRAAAKPADRSGRKTAAASLKGTAAAEASEVRDVQPISEPTS